MNPFPKVFDDAPGKGGTEEEQLMQMLQSNPELMQKYKEELAKFQAQAQRGAQHPPMTSQQYIQKLDTIEKYFDNEGGLTIEPAKALVLKFLEKRSGEKIFVNIVTHEVIDHPEQKLLVDFQNQPGLRIPMSMGRVREDSDKNGTPCKVVDVVLNPTIVKTAEANPDIMNFTAQIIGNYLLEKYKIAVNDEIIKRVKGLKYKGSKVEIQRVKGRKAPKIEQISEQDREIRQRQQQKEEEVLNEMSNAPSKQIMRPEFQIWAETDAGWEPYSLEARDVRSIRIVVELPHLIHSRGIHLEGSTEMLYLSVKNLYELCLRIPFEVTSFKCRFGKKERKLEVRAHRRVEETGIQPKDQGTPKKTVVEIEMDNDLLYDLV